MVFRKKVLILLMSFVNILLCTDDVRTIFTHGAFAHPGQAKRFKPTFPSQNNYQAVRFLDNQKEPSWNPLSLLISFAIKKITNVDYAPSLAYFGQKKMLR